MEDQFTPQDIEKITLKMLSGAASKNNFKILRLLPNTVREMMQATGLSRSTVNNRAKLLVKLCLADRRKGNDNITLTELGVVIVDTITKIQKLVAFNVKKRNDEENK
jgi:predicted transcriptional regulator